MSRMVINDEMWARLELLLPKPQGQPGKDDRLLIEGVCWILRTGAPWRDLPPDYGSWKTVYNRYNNWSKQGHIQAILDELKRKMAIRNGTCLMGRLLKFIKMLRAVA